MIGETGSGKSTLLKQLLPIADGKSSGSIETELLRDTNHFAYVSQFVDNQLIMETPRDELKFILDNQGQSDNEIGLRIAEIASFLGIINLLDEPIKNLSGGQKQLINLASALILKPQVLLLDEPTSQLDPIAAEKLLQMVHKVNVEFDMTIVLVEHKLDQVIQYTNRLAVMEAGHLIVDQSTSKALQTIFVNSRYQNYLTQIDRLFLELNLPEQVSLPLNNKELSSIIHHHQAELQFKDNNISIQSDRELFSVSQLNFRFKYNGNNIVDNISFKLMKGLSYCVVGPNGMGKTTLLKVITQQLQKQSGHILFAGQKLTQDFYRNVFVLPQDPATLFAKDTVAKEVEFQIELSQSQQTIENVLEVFSLKGLEDVSPYDLSGGQQEFLALALGFIKNPQILFLDEPTKGLDPNKRMELGRRLKEFQEKGGTVFVNSHDLLFAAQYFDQIAMMFDGKLSDFNSPQAFFSHRYFYTTEINKALRDIFPKALSWKDIEHFES
ncbi:ABC transporter [Companilactobacillus futsaii JCM 17355]|nr:ABC transporter [Companilactobacillus futsaii JCM 17355]